VGARRLPDRNTVQTRYLGNSFMCVAAVVLLVVPDGRSVSLTVPGNPFKEESHVCNGMFTMITMSVIAYVSELCQFCQCQ
jgi:hypothetical protein